MIQFSTFFNLLQNATKCGFTERFIKTTNGKIHPNSSLFSQYTLQEVLIVETILCPQDKSRLLFIKTPDGLQGVLVEYLEFQIYQ